ncbi:MAG: PAS domain S-box protein, partial [Leptospiraceae bacterium]|nr:PAS domain S-box protein [Leptospiraceae bacterium]
MGNVAEFLVFEEVSDRTSAILFDSGKIFKNRKNESISEIDYKTYSFTKEIKIQNSGRTWKIRTVSTPDFEKGSNTGMPIFVLGAGLLISLLVAGILASIAQTKERAQALAEQMTIKLQRSEEEARIAFRNLSNQKYALDQHAIVAITDVGGKIIYANDKFCEISKYSRDELIGQNHRILKSGYHPTEFFEEMFKTISNGMVWKGEIKNCKKDGSFYWVATTIVPFRDVEGKIFEYISMRIDITELKEIEEKLRIA